MNVQKLEQIAAFLSAGKEDFHANFGITKIGIFGSFVSGKQKEDSDIDLVIEMEKEKKTLQNFLKFKRLLEKEFQRTVDLGFEHTLKPAIKEKLKGHIHYV